MTSTSPDRGSQFLTVAEAAAALGQSRLRVREAVARGALTGRRDNEGQLRVDLPASGAPVPENGALDPDALLGLLFDEVEELQDLLGSKERDLLALGTLVEGQGAALEQADQALSQSEMKQERLSGLLERALSHLEASEARSDRLRQIADRALEHLEGGQGQSDPQKERLTAVTERALEHLDRTTKDLETSQAQAARYDALLSRALDMAQQGGTDPAMEAAAERALGLLDDALARAEAGHQAQGRAGALLERALQTGERLQGELAEGQDTIKRQQRQIDATLSMSERAVELAAKTSTHVEKKGFFRRLFGL